MSFEDDLQKARQLIKSDTHAQLKRSGEEESYASWIKPGQSLNYYIWTDNETGAHEIELEKNLLLKIGHI